MIWRRLNYLLSILKEKGIAHAIYWTLIIVGKKFRLRTITPASLIYFFRGIKFKPYFTFNGNHYRYLYHRHNYTWCSEREVEIPIAMEVVKEHSNKKVLEVGNVLNGYYKLEHDVLDKYEIAKNVINSDVVGFNNGKKYDLIVSISTIEHVGWDEPKRDRLKILKALDSLKVLLSKNGVILFTVPLGYNRYLDELLGKNKIKVSEAYFLKRVSADNRWIEASWDEVKDSKYGKPFEAANAIMVGVIRR